MMTLMARGVERRGEQPPDPPATDDDHLHAWISAGIGSRTTQTAHGAFLRT